MNDTMADFVLEIYQHISYRLACVIIGIISIFGNTMTIVAILRRQKLQTIPNKFILNLAVADLLMVGQIILKMMVTAGVNDGPICMMTAIVWETSTLVSISSLVLVAGDRFVYIYRPLRYPLIITSCRANIVIASTWLIVAMFCLVMVIWSVETGVHIICEPFYRTPFWFQASQFAVYVVMVALMFTFYSLLIRIVLKQRRIIAIQRGANAEKKPADYKFLKMILPIALVSELCWVPYISLIALSIFGWPQYIHIASPYIGLAFYVNAALNFFVYAARNRDFLNTYKYLLYIKTDEDIACVHSSK